MWVKALPSSEHEAELGDAAGRGGEVDGDVGDGDISRLGRTEEGVSVELEGRGDPSESRGLLASRPAAAAFPRLSLMAESAASLPMRLLAVESLQTAYEA